MLSRSSPQRTELEDFIRKNESVVSPLRRLPNGMLAEIFRHSVNVAAPSDPAHNNGWVLFRVCRRWRSVALATSELWNHFVNKRDEGAHASAQVPEKCGEMQLERAHNAPLTIHLAHPLSPAFWDRLFAVAHRWKDIMLLENKHFARFASLGIAFPLLRKLVVDDDVGLLLPTDAADANLVPLLLASTSLYLRLPSTTSAPVVTAPDVYTAHFRWILPHLPQDSHLTLRVLGEGEGGAPITTRIESLAITGGTKSTRGDLLDVLVAPRLQKLIICIWRTRTPSQPPSSAFGRDRNVRCDTCAS